MRRGLTRGITGAIDGIMTMIFDSEHAFQQGFKSLGSCIMQMFVLTVCVRQDHRLSRNPPFSVAAGCNSRMNCRTSSMPCCSKAIAFSNAKSAFSAFVFRRRVNCSRLFAVAVRYCSTSV